MDASAILLAVVPILLAITVQEAMHGYVAKHYGDNTAELLGRLTLNPLAHIDLIGTVLVPLVSYLLFKFPIGWAKPVPVNGRLLRNPRVAWRMVALAGPLSNLAMAAGWGLLMALVPLLPEMFKVPFQGMCEFGISINSVLFVINMIPVLPLDGGRFVDTFLSPKASMQFRKIEPYGMWVVFALLWLGVLNAVLAPVISFIQALAWMLGRLL